MRIDLTATSCRTLPANSNQDLYQTNIVVVTRVDGTGPPIGDGRRAKCGDSATARSALDKGKLACSSRVKNGKEKDRCYTSASEKRNPCEYARGAGGRSPLGSDLPAFPTTGTWNSCACGGGGNVAVVMGDVRRPSPRPRCRAGGHSTD